MKTLPVAVQVYSVRDDAARDFKGTMQKLKEIGYDSYITIEREIKGGASAGGIFAAKEAVAKALGTGFVGFGFADVEILSDKKGKPVVRLHGDAAALVRDANVHLSISHDGGMAMAFAVIESKGGDS